MVVCAKRGKIYKIKTFQNKVNLNGGLKNKLLMTMEKEHIKKLKKHVLPLSYI